MSKLHSLPIIKFDGPHRFLSNFYPCSVTLDGVVYPSTEHAYQAAKTLDPAARATVLATRSCGDARRLGQTVPLRPGWEQMKFGVMFNLLAQKFVPGSQLAWQLVQTGEGLLVEGNTWHDNTYGICGCENTGNGKGCTSPPTGKSQLGEMLMEIRKQLHAYVVVPK